MKRFLPLMGLAITLAASPLMTATSRAAERFPLAAPTMVAPTIAKEDSLETGDRIPDYLRVVATVSPTAAPGLAKLVSMKKDDSALTPDEKAAVDFARKLTKGPSKVTDADFAALQEKFPGRGAADVLMQTCNFAFMNRFTDNLRLPSEDEAIHIYKETYGHDYDK